jgi:benzoyl-CoA reductase/2-hydroxyglutaryl-CoA dehydratase subunit BcrC/BadD/HgdB
LQELKAALEAIAVRRIEAGDVARAIVASNKRRALLRACLEARGASPARLRGTEAIKLIAAAGRLAPEAFEGAAARLRDLLPKRAGVASGPRIVLAGDAPDVLDVHALVESLGALVVGDRHDMGEPAIGEPIDEGAAPLRALSDHYHRHFVTSRTFPAAPNALADFAKAVSADGVVFFFHAEEEVLTWDYPAEKACLDAAGVRSLCLTRQSYRPDAEALKSALAGFLPSLRVGAR